MVGIANLVPLKNYAVAAVHSLPLITRVTVAVIRQDRNYYDIERQRAIIGTDSNITSNWAKIDFKELQTVIVDLKVGICTSSSSFHWAE